MPGFAWINAGLKRVRLQFIQLCMWASLPGLLEQAYSMALKFVLPKRVIDLPVAALTYHVITFCTRLPFLLKFNEPDMGSLTFYTFINEQSTFCRIFSFFSNVLEYE